MIRTRLQILDSGSCEVLKAGVHGAALGLAGIMALYNGAAWLRRRQRHLAINAMLYGAAILWEQHHCAHHLAARCKEPLRVIPGAMPADSPVATRLRAVPSQRSAA